MSGKADFQSQFRAAKSGRAAAAKLSRAQIRELKEKQRAQAGPSDVRHVGSVSAGADTTGPTETSTAGVSQSSQITQLEGPGIAHASAGPSSVNQAAPGSESRQPSVTSALHGRATLPEAAQQVPGKDGRNMPAPKAGPGAPSLPPDFFSIPDPATSGQNTVSHNDRGAGTEPTQGAIPKGFFADKAADAKARGEKPISKNQMATEYAAFMKHVEVDSTAAASQQAAEEQESATDRQARDEFEQFVRLQRVQQLQRSVAAHAKGVDADPILEQAVAILTEPEAAVRLPEQALAKKRKAAAALALTGDGSESGSDGGEELDLVDWRSKKSSTAGW
ncbi:hypothetical protein ACKKBG_A04375 [Auxenochlorella protothecoides x Auxenochlorella symbiontica]